MIMNLLSPKQSGLVPASNKHAWASAEETAHRLLCLLTSAPHVFFLTLWYIITAMQWWLFEVCRASFPLCLQMAIKAVCNSTHPGCQTGALKVSPTTTFLAPVHCGQLLILSENHHGVTHMCVAQATKAAVHQRCCFVQSQSSSCSWEMVWEKQPAWRSAVLIHTKGEHGGIPSKGKVWKEQPVLWKLSFFLPTRCIISWHNHRLISTL